MNEKELLEKIEQSAKDLKVPEYLHPEAVKERISLKKKSRTMFYRTVAAAVVLVICVLLCNPVMRKSHEKVTDIAESGSMEEDMAGSEGETMVAEEKSEEEDAKEISEDIDRPKQDAGDLFVVANDYGEVYDALKKQEIAVSRVYDYDAFTEGSVSGAADKGSMETEDAAAGYENKLMSSELSEVRELASTDYSRTNLQTAGVDESDFVKTDGKFVYVVKDNSVVIVDVSTSTPAKKGEIALPDESSSDDVLEMYVDDGIMNIIVQREKTKLAKDGDVEKDNFVEDVYRFDTNAETEILTYDIADPTKPVLKGSTGQDGYYKSSRKIGNILYLFTTKRAELPAVVRERAIMEENAGGWIPLVNGKAVKPGCIYLSETGTEGLLISSVNIKRPEDTVDTTFILNDYAEIYVSTEALYLYYSDYGTGSDARTNIAKFSLNRGRIDAVGAASVMGTVMDTFAVNESSDAKLRILTTSDGWSTEEGNNLYILDENLKMTGKLTGIAPGEQIYAARYFGDTAYFVTYRNTDPLFAVDLSDDKNPKLLGELKITGFSEYLHFWGENKLAGIGYETDPDTGERKGMKVTMFDISDPVNLREVKSMILKDVDYSDALYDYKSVLADASQNLIGFPTESYTEDNEYRYLLFTWDGSAFKELLSDTLEEEASQGCRGMYIGDKFVIATKGNIKVFDRKRGYQFIANLVL